MIVMWYLVGGLVLLVGGWQLFFAKSEWEQMLESVIVYRGNTAGEISVNGETHTAEEFSFMPPQEITPEMMDDPNRELYHAVNAIKLLQQRGDPVYLRQPLVISELHHGDDVIVNYEREGFVKLPR